MPDLTGKTPDEARAFLRAAGIEPRELKEDMKSTCSYDQAHPSYKLFTICYQRPAPGQTVYSRGYITYELERSAPGRGYIGTEFEYVIMPDIWGKSLDEAKKILADVGLPLEKHFDVKVGSTGERCEPDVVCYTSPGRKLQKRLTSRGTITLGPPAPPRPPTPASQPAQPSQPGQPAQPSQPAQPEKPKDTYF